MEKFIRENNLGESAFTYALKCVEVQIKKEARDAERRTKKKDRDKKMIDLLTEGYSLEEIGSVFLISRERVRQLLKICIGFDEYKKILLENKAKRTEKNNLERTQVCVVCNTTFGYKGGKKRKFCSRLCHKTGIRTRQYPDWAEGISFRKENFTPDQWKEIYRIRAKSYYAKHKVRLAKKARERYKKNKELQNIYGKRCRERKIYGEALTDIPAPKRPQVMKP